MAYIKGQFDVTQHVDSNGDPAASYILKFFIWNTSTPTAVYSDSSGTSAGTEITLNSLGQPQSSGGTAIDLFFDDTVTYKAQLYQSDGTTTVGPVIGPYNVIPNSSVQADKEYASVAALIASSGNTNYNNLYISSYYAVSYPDVDGPKGGMFVHRTGGTNASPTVGTAVSVSTTGTGTQSGYFWDADGDEWEISNLNQRITSFMLGAKGDDSTDDLSKLDDFVDFLAARDVKGVMLDGAYRVTDTWNLDESYLNIEFEGNAYISPDASVLVGMEIGNASSPPTRMNIVRPKVDRGTLATGTENIGIQFVEMNQSSVHDAESRFSKYNLKWVAETAGCAYNNFHNPQGIGGVRNLWLDATSPGFTNENNFFGGRAFDSGSMVTNLYIEGGTACNNNRFYGICVEGSGTQAIYCDGQQNLFIQPRTEGTWSLDDVVFGANARFNRVETSRLDLSITDYSPDDTNTWITRGSGSKHESGDNNIFHNRRVHSGAHTTAAGSPVTISGATQASPVVVTATSHGLSTGSYVVIRQVGGMTEINGQVFRLGTTATNTFELLDPATGDNVDGTAFTAYTSGGYAMPGVPMNSIEDIDTSSAGSHLYDFYHGEDNASSYVFRSIRDSDGLVRSSLTTDGRLTLARKLDIEQSGYTFEPFQMGNHYFWMNGNDFRGSIGAPTSATDGTLIATLT